MAIEKTVWPRAPFPEDLKTHPLLIIDYGKIASGDLSEVDRLYEACTSIGFFYLTNYGVTSQDIDGMFEMGEATFAMPTEELDKFEQGDSGMSAGYKRAGSTNVDAAGNVDTAYFINVAKDDALAYPEVKQRTYPSETTKRMNTVTSFVRKADNVLQGLMASLEPKLGVPVGTLAKLHKEGEISGSETRCILKPAPGGKNHVPEGVGADGKPSAAIGSHTDFGSFSLLHGRGTGGLQVLTPGSEEWQYIKPLEGCAVCNVGDTLSVYSGGILRSNIHRVVPPPGEQGKYDRWSLVYFLRPAYQNELYPLDSEVIRKAAAEHPTISKMEHGVTAGDWFQRRVRNQRAANRTGPESWAASRGTEHNPSKD